LDMCAHAADAAKVHINAKYITIYIHLILYRFGSCQL
jgi:hypothetical protein